VFYVNDYVDASTFSFTDEALFRGVEDAYWGWGTDFIDVENDGDLDIVAVNGFDEFILDGFSGEPDPQHPDLYAPTVLFVNDSLGMFTRTIPAGLDSPRDSRGLVAFDYDRDGDRDLLVTNTNQPAQLLENVSDPMGNWLDVAVIQNPGLNRNGIGVTVYATIGSVTKRRDIISGVSYLVGTPAEVHFGLGDADIIDRLDVEWTDGTKSFLLNVGANQRIVIDQGLQDIPTVSEIGVAILAVLLLFSASTILRRRRIAS
jgi:hypothetical protein